MEGKYYTKDRDIASATRHAGVARWRVPGLQRLLPFLEVNVFGIYVVVDEAAQLAGLIINNKKALKI